MREKTKYNVFGFEFLKTLGLLLCYSKSDVLLVLLVSIHCSDSLFPELNSEHLRLNLLLRRSSSFKDYHYHSSDVM
jgi:hypothetical protein